jgi:hypothetical protein
MRMTVYMAVAFVVSLSACKKELKEDYANLKNFEFSGLVIPLPGSFVQTHIDSLIERWQQLDARADVIVMNVKYFESLRSRGDSFAIFADTTDINNTVLIFTGPYIKMSKWASEELYLILDKRLRAEAKALDVGFTPIENSYYSLNNGNDILKIKFEWNNNSITSYGTQYILNTRGSTFGIVVKNYDYDFENLVRRAKFSDD